MTTKQLEDAARAAHTAGWTWDSFYRQHERTIREAAPYDRRAFGRLYLRLFNLLIAGDLDGERAVGDEDAMPWEKDDALGQVSDTHTQAKLQPGTLFDARPMYE